MSDIQPHGPVRPSKARRRQALERIDRLLHDWGVTGNVALGEAEQAAALAEDLGDKMLEARAQLLLAAAGAGLRPPDAALQSLAQALRVFEANLMGRERSQCLLLAAALLIDAGSADTALTLLPAGDPEGTPDPLHGPERQCQRLALRACALQDQGRLDEALVAARAALDPLDPVRTSPRVHAQVSALCAEVLLAARLRSLGIDTHLSLFSGPAAPADADGPPPGPELLQDMPPLRPWLAGQTPEGAGLQLMEAAATQPGNSRLLADLARWSLLAASDFSRSATSLWLRLGTAYRLMGQDRLAADCLRRATTLAEANGQERLLCRAHFELAQALAGLADFAGAYAAQKALQTAMLRRLSAPPRRWPDGIAREAFAADGAALAGGLVGAPDPEQPLPRRGPPLHVRRAQHFMALQLGQRLTVSDVARHCGVSRRTLEMAFRSELDLAVAECLREMRLQAVKQRLSHTDLPIKRIAHDLGYGSASSLSRDFRRATGLAPAQYRNQSDPR